MPSRSLSYALGTLGLVWVCGLLVSCGTPKTPTEPPASAGHLVVLTNFSFTPRELTIRAGDTVTFRVDEGFHNVVADDGSFRCARGCNGADGDPASGWTFTRTFDTAGRVPFYCEVHGGKGGAGMSGVLTVEAH